MKQILIINTCGLGVGGITTHMLNYIEKLDIKRLKIDIIGTIIYDENIIKEFKKIGCNVIYLPNRQKNLFQYCWYLYKNMRLTNYDIVHIHGNSFTMIFELFLSKINKIPIRIAHTHNIVCSHPYFNKIFKGFLKCFYTTALACSKAAGDILFPKGYYVLPNSIDTSHFVFSYKKRCYIRKEKKISDDTTVIGHIGNLCEQKNQEMLIKIFNEYQKINSNSVLWLIGDGIQSEKDKLQKLVMEFDLESKIFFLGIQKDIPLYLAGMDCFVFPSKWEGLGIVLLEAQSSGLPCIVSNMVPSEVKCSKSFNYLPLNSSLTMWSNTIDEIMDKSERNNLCEENIQNLLNRGFDISDSISLLKQIYELD